MSNFAQAAAWLATAVAVAIGIYFTHSAWCLWGMFIPLLSAIAGGEDDE